MKFLRLVLLLPLVLGPGYLSAASDGDAGRNSRGTIEISLSIVPSIQINVVNDINLTIIDRQVDTNFTEVLCITGNLGGKYNLIAYGSGGQDFSLKNAEGESLSYFVGYRGDPGAQQFDELNAGEASPAYDLVTDSANCSDEHSFRVTFKSEDLGKVGSGLYTGNLTLLVAPV